MGSIYMGTRKICFLCSLQEQMSSEWVGDVGSASVSIIIYVLGGWGSMLRGILLLPRPSIYVLCCTSEAKRPWCISCHGLSISPRLGLGKVHGPGTYIITRIAMTQTQKQKYARSQQPGILFLDLLLNLSYHCTLTDTTDPLPYMPKSTTRFHSQMNKFF